MNNDKKSLSENEFEIYSWLFMFVHLFIYSVCRPQNNVVHTENLYRRCRLN